MKVYSLKNKIRDIKTYVNLHFSAIIDLTTDLSYDQDYTGFIKINSRETKFPLLIAIMKLQCNENVKLKNYITIKVLNSAMPIKICNKYIINAQLLLMHATVENNISL